MGVALGVAVAVAFMFVASLMSRKKLFLGQNTKSYSYIKPAYVYMFLCFWECSTYTQIAKMWEVTSSDIRDCTT
jgi:hypothetical protein